MRNDGTPDFVIVDVSTPASPVLVGSLSLTGAPANIAVSGNYAYVTSNSNSQELQIINISNPASPSQVGSFDASGNADGRSVQIVGTTAYLTRSGGAGNEFFIVNVANPASPALVGSLALGQTIYDVAVSGNYAFVAGASNQPELRVVDISNPAAPALAGNLNLSGNNDAYALAIFGTLVFFIMQLFDFSSLQKRESDDLTRQAEVAEYIGAKITAGDITPLSGTYTSSVTWPPVSGSRTYYYQLAFTAPVAPSTVTNCAIAVAPGSSTAFSTTSPDNYKLIVPIN